MRKGLGRYANGALERLRLNGYRLSVRDQAFDVQFDRFGDVALGFFERLPLRVTARQQWHNSDVAALVNGLEENRVSARGFLFHDYTSRLRTSSAFSSMNLRRASTSSPISVVNIWSLCTRSSSETFNRVRVSMSIVVDQSCSGFISPSPLYRCTVTSRVPSFFT